MTATVAKSAAPAHAVLVWADERNVYAQLPSQNAPYVACFPFTEGGLSAVLKHLGAMHIEHSGEPYLRPIVPTQEMKKLGLTQNDREAARDVLKKIGVIP
jgi:hypothetical protein